MNSLPAPKTDSAPTFSLRSGKRGTPTASELEQLRSARPEVVPPRHTADPLFFRQNPVSFGSPATRVSVAETRPCGECSIRVDTAGSVCCFHILAVGKSLATKRATIEMEQEVNCMEVRRRWDGCRHRSAIHRLPQWLNWRLSKKIAKWSGRPRKRETKLFWGQAMTVVYPEYVSSRIARYGYFETDMTSMFIDVLQPGMRVYDVGSHFGYFSLLASEIVGESGHVFAFEPTTETFQVLKENAARTGNITCNNIAAFRETGEITFLDQGLDDSSLNFIVNDEAGIQAELRSDNANLIRVPAVRLDEFADQHGDPDFVKIDAEGAEGPILEGMSGIIERCHPGISLEMGDKVCQKTGSQPCRENIDFLMDRGYEVYDYRTCRQARHEIRSSYSYDNLFFRHPEWKSGQAHPS